ncbi:MAG: threonine ammonia-lyase [Clostridia bacterium]|nr:threonine ammonia-lyase [Clostridia bacterium]
MNTVTLGMILEARERLKAVVRKTDLINSRQLRQLVGTEVYLKAECLQHTGSFKLRGAYNMISQLSPEQKACGVIASSAGNHAQGVALAAQSFGVKATIVMPAGAPLAKVAATRELGAEVVLHGAVYDDAFNKAMELQKETGATFVHPFNDPLVIAGQGSVGVEILDKLPDVDQVIVPIGGGGLISGVAIALKKLRPSVKIIGVQAAGAASMVQSISQGKPVQLSSASTIADGIAVKRPGDLTYEIVNEYVDEIVTVDEDEIAAGILTLLEKCKLIAEGAGAVPVAALLHGKIKPEGKICCLVSGGNIDVNMLQRIVDRGLAKSGRIGKITLLLPDKPGMLTGMLTIIAKSGANVLSIGHDRVYNNSSLNTARVELTIETHNQEHLNEVLRQLEENGYEVLGA